MNTRKCEHCVYYAPIKQATGQPARGQCRKSPRPTGFGTTNSNDWCGEGQFKITTINPAGSQRLYDLNGNATGFYHNVLDE